MEGRLENEIAINNRINKITSSLPSFVKEWHNTLHASKVTASSRYTYVNNIKRFLEYVNADAAKVSCDDITEANVVSYFISTQTKKDKDGNIVSTSDSFQQMMYCSLNNFLQFMYSHKYIDRNYIEAIKKPKNKDLDRLNKTRVLLTEREFKLILHYAYLEQDPIIRSRDLAVLMIFMNTGIRREALRSINLSDVDFSDNTLVVVDKGDKTQVYTLGSKCVDAIKEWLEQRKNYEKAPTEALFISYQGNRLSGESVAKIVSKYSKKALGKELRPHKLRAGFCSILYSQKEDIEFVSRAVGHSDISTTRRYIVTDGSERKQAASIIDSIL